jgi:hypothetical protein
MYGLFEVVECLLSAGIQCSESTSRWEGREFGPRIDLKDLLCIQACQAVANIQYFKAFVVPSGTSRVIQCMMFIRLSNTLF